METVICDGTWPAARVHEIKPEVSPGCPRCGHPNEDVLHTFWTCPCNNNIEDETVQNIQYLIENAIEQHNIFPCIWLRAMLPADKTRCVHKHLFEGYNFVSSSQEFKQTLGEIIKCRADAWPSGIYFGDGAEGIHNEFPHLRQCGVGVCRFFDQYKASHL